jgi:hypothetical protein
LNDEIWKGTLETIHKGKDIPKAIREAYLFLQVEGRLLRGNTGDFKKCIQSFLSNQKNSQAIKETKNWKVT